MRIPIRSLGLSLSLVACAGGPPVLRETPRASRIFLHGNSGAQATMQSALEAGLTPEAVLQRANPGSLGPSLETDLEGVGATAHVHVDASDPQALDVFFLFGAPPRLYAQVLRDEEGLGVVQQERLLQLIDATLVAIEEGVALGTAPAEARQELAARGIVADETTPTTGPLLSLRGSGTLHGEEFFLRGGGGIAVGYSFALAPRLALDLSIAGELSAGSADGPSGDSRLLVVTPRGRLEFRGSVGSLWFGLQLAAGASFLRAETTAAAGFESLGPTWDREGLFQAALTLRWSPVSFFALGLLAGVELAPAPVEYVQEGTNTPVVSGLPVRPTIALEATFWPWAEKQ